MKRLKLIAIVLAAMAAWANAACAQGYPNKPIRLVIPYPAGAGIDAVGRPLADKLSQIIGERVIVDNIAGANGILAMERVAKAPPDGYTIILALNAQVATNPALYRKVPYDPIKDYAPIVLLGSAPYFLFTVPQFPANSLGELLALARGKPGGLIYASAGSGSGAHLAMELIKSMAGVSIVHAPYKTTTAAIPDVIAGNVHIMVTVAGNARGLVEAGRLKAIAATSAKRSTVFPDVPTVAESGLPGYESTVWYCVLAPAGTPSSIVNRLNADILKAIQAPDLRQRLETGASMELTGSTPEELGRYIRSELRKWAKVVKDSGAKID